MQEANRILDEVRRQANLIDVDFSDTSRSLDYSGAAAGFQFQCPAPFRYKLENCEEEGFLAIRRLPIFSANTRCDDSGQEWQFEEECLGNACSEHARLKAEQGHRVAVFKDHHDPKQPDVSRELIGYLDNLEMGTFPIDGQELPTIFADVCHIDAEKWGEEIRKGRLPFRSVEIKNPERAMISGMALMETVPPYFKFANMVVEDATLCEVQHANVTNFRAVARAIPGGAAGGATFFYAGAGRCRGDQVPIFRRRRERLCQRA